MRMSTTRVSGDPCPRWGPPACAQDPLSSLGMLWLCWGPPSSLGSPCPHLSLSLPFPVPLIRTMESRIMIPLKISPLQ